MTPQCVGSVVQVLVVRVDIGVMTYMITHVDMQVVFYESMTPKCGRSMVQVLLVTLDIGHPCGGSDLVSYNNSSLE